MCISRFNQGSRISMRIMESQFYTNQTLNNWSTLASPGMGEPVGTCWGISELAYLAAGLGLWRRLMYKSVCVCVCVYKAFYLPTSINKLEVIQMHSITIKCVYHQRHFPPRKLCIQICFGQSNYVNLCSEIIALSDLVIKTLIFVIII